MERASLLAGCGLGRRRVTRAAAAAGAEQAGAGHAEAGGERQRGAAEAAFGREAADMPVRAAAAGAAVHFAAPIGDVIAAPCLILRETPNQHHSAPWRAP